MTFISLDVTLTVLNNVGETKGGVIFCAAEKSTALQKNLGEPEMLMREAGQIESWKSLTAVFV